MRRTAALVLWGGLSLGCGRSSWAVPDYPQPDYAPAQMIPQEPPPAQIEYLPDQPPAPGCRWVDGQWIWASQHWTWQPGGWVHPPADCRYSAPAARWDLAQGRPALYYRLGRWYSLSRPEACVPVPCAETGSTATPRGPANSPPASPAPKT